LDQITCQGCDGRFHTKCILNLKSVQRPARPYRGDVCVCAECSEVLGTVTRGVAKQYGSTISGLSEVQPPGSPIAVAAAAAVSAAAARAAQRAGQRARSKLHASGDKRSCQRLIAVEAFHAARRTASRLQLAVQRRLTALTAADSDLSFACQVLESGCCELFYTVIGLIEETLSLRSISCVCRRWNRLLDRSQNGTVRQIWKSAWLIAPRARLSLTLAIRTTRPGDRLRISAGTHAEALVLPHPLNVLANGATLSAPLTLEGSCKNTQPGVLRGLTFQHFYHTALTVTGGHWVLDGCSIQSSRASRACAGIAIRNDAHVELVSCTITSCSHAALLSSRACSLRARDTTFTNVRAAIVSEKAGHIDVRDCSFHVQNPHDVAMRLCDETSGTFVNNAVSGSVWGRVAPPPAVVLTLEQDS